MLVGTSVFSLKLEVALLDVVLLEAVLAWPCATEKVAA